MIPGAVTVRLILGRYLEDGARASYRESLPPTSPQTEADMTNHLRPNLSETLPNTAIAIVTQAVHTMENKLALALGPMSSLMTVMMAAAGENAQ